MQIRFMLLSFDVLDDLLDLDRSSDALSAARPMHYSSRARSLSSIAPIIPALGSNAGGPLVNPRACA
jgi:hypothetical protein